MLLLVHKSLNRVGPTYLSDLLTQYEPCRPLQSAGSGLLTVPRIKTGRGEAAFSFHAAQLRNKLPENLRLEAVLSSFRFKLKTYFFTTVFR